MSFNWVMLSDDKLSFAPLPGESSYYQSPIRTSVSITNINKNAPASEAFRLESNSGTCYLTNCRIIYLPKEPSLSSTLTTFESFAAPIQNFRDALVSAPFFGPNYWRAIVQPVPGGNFPSYIRALEIKMTFREGGAFDFHSTFERIRERISEVLDAAQTSGHEAIQAEQVHLDELPTYEEGRIASTNNASRHLSGSSRPNAEAPSEIPSEAPPKYEDL